MACSREARLLFIGMWNFADDLGHIPNAPLTLKAQIFPGDDLTVENVRRMLDELSTNSLLSSYRVEKKDYFTITGWHHQKIDRPQKPKYPIPLDDNSSNDRRTLVDREEHRAEPISDNGAQTRARDPWVLFRIEAVQTAEKHNSLPAHNSVDLIDRWKANGFPLDLSRSVLLPGIAKKPDKGLPYWEAVIRGEMEKKNPHAKNETQDEKESRWCQTLDKLAGERPWPFRFPSEIPADFASAHMRAKQQTSDLDIPPFLDRRAQA